MWTVIAIEGIDRIGKSTFINELSKRFENTLIEKPTIGINTLKKMGYPLQDIPHIMEIRNIGLFEEFLYQAQEAYNNNFSKVIIRDRFNLSELAYGIAYRPHMFRRALLTFEDIDEPINLYRKWNNWFEQELDKCSNTYLITFVLDESSYPNEDEAISAKDLVKVNKQFIEEHEKSIFKNKMLIKLHKNPETGYTDILEYIDKIVFWITNQYVNDDLTFRFNTLKNTSKFVIQIAGGFIYPIGKETEENSDIIELFNGDKFSKSDLFKILEPYSKELVEKVTNNIEFGTVSSDGLIIFTEKGKAFVNEFIESILYKAIADIDASTTNELPFEPANNKDDVPF